MVVNIEGPVYVIDQFAIRAFVEIFNTIVVAEHPADLNKKLLIHGYRPEYRSLNGYFKWDFDDQSFWLQQRVQYRSENLFEHCVLTVSFRSIKGHFNPKIQ